MAYTEQDCIKDTTQHIDTVRIYLITVATELLRRAMVHDASKLKSPELEYFTEFTPKLADVTYMSDEYKGFLKELQPALNHHYANNSHHPEQFKNGVNGMDIADVVEMLCDWKAASMRHKDGDIVQSIKNNTERFDLSPQLVDIFNNSLGLLELEEEILSHVKPILDGTGTFVSANISAGIGDIGAVDSGMYTELKLSLDVESPEEVSE